MKPFTKLFSSIISSSIWRSPKETKVVWITMLAMSDKDGEVWASVGGLADMARVTKGECRKALDELLAPDDDSRTKENEGRRIEEVDGGWLVLNYKKYREMGRGEDRREYFAENKRVNRAKQAECPQVSTVSTPCPRLSPIAEAEAEAEAEADKKNTRIQARADDGDLCAPSTLPTAPASEADHWQMHERNQEWAKALKAASCKIGRDNWTAWKSLVDEHSLTVTLSAAKGVLATERWPDRVESTLTASRGQQNPGDVVKTIKMSLL